MENKDSLLRMLSGALFSESNEAEFNIALGATTFDPAYSGGTTLKKLTRGTKISVQKCSPQIWLEGGNVGSG